MTSARPVIRLRRSVALAAFAGALCLAGAPFAPIPAHAQQQAPTTERSPVQMGGPASVADLAEGLLDAVVNISTAQNAPQQRGGGGPRPGPAPRLPEGSPFQDFFDEFFREREGGGTGPRRVQSLGSGFVIDAEEGIVITNNHVIADADEIEVNFADGGKLSAELVGVDPATDLAVLRVDPDLRELRAVPLGDSNDIRIGDWVMAIGNPFGLGGSVSVGIVSARGRDINSGPYDDFIQTDAAINRGNSGGPLFNMRGEVIGINTAIISPTGGSIGIGFAIPSTLANTVIGQLREFGETRRGWLGVRIQPVTDDIAESLGMARAEGALVAGVMAGGPVDDGTIQPGDVILEFDGRAIRTMRDLPRIVAESPVGQEVEVRIVRRGEEEIVAVTLGRLEDSERLGDEVIEEEADEEGTAPAETTSILGLTLVPLDRDARVEFEIDDDITGVVVIEVEPGSAAEERGIQPGDIITEIAQEAVDSPNEVVERIEGLRNQGRRNALLMLASRTGELRFVTVRMD